MESKCGRNQAILRGTALAEPRYSHQNHGTRYFTFPLEVRRLSGTADVINVAAAEPLLERCPVSAGDSFRVEGEVRSYNNRSGVGHRLVITLLARTMTPWEGEHGNRLELEGVVCRPPSLRRTPLGREICDVLLAVNRRYGRADYLPCIAWGSLARICGTMDVGDTLSLEGRLQSRAYRKVLPDGSERELTAYEVSIMAMETEDSPED